MEKEIHESSEKKHILLTSLGTQAIPTKYRWNGETKKAKLTPLALVQLLDKRDLPNRVVAVVTTGAATTTWPVFQKGVKDHLGIEPDKIDIPDGRNANEIREILELVADKVPKNAELTLDVTQGFRHFPFIFYALVLYLKSLRSVDIRGAYYGMVDIPSDDSKPIIDLQPLLQLPEWFHAVRMFRDQGTTKPMAEQLHPLSVILNAEKERLFRDHKQEAGKKRLAEAQQVQNSVKWLENYAFAYESALPLELAKASRGLINSIKGLPAIVSADLPPLVDELTRAIVNAAEESAFKKFPSGGMWKQNIPLNTEELKRQARMIDLYLERDQLSLAVGLMREWVVSWAIWKSGKTKDIQQWLDNRNVRSRYEGILGAILASARSKGLPLTMTPKQKDFRVFYDQLTQNLRNALHHHAMRPESLETEPTVSQNVKTFWNQLKVDGLNATGGIELPPLGGQLLISPQGGSPGVLFSALKVANPDTCLVICSQASISSIAPAANAAGFKGHIEKIELSDPIGGFTEIDAVAQSVEGYLTYADKVIANITGGSTLMGVIVQRLVEDAQKFDCSVERFALIDRRPTEEQDKNPFVKSDSHWLDRNLIDKDMS